MWGLRGRMGGWIPIIHSFSVAFNPLSNRLSFHIPILIPIPIPIRSQMLVIHATLEKKGKKKNDTTDETHDPLPSLNIIVYLDDSSHTPYTIHWCRIVRRARRVRIPSLPACSPHIHRPFECGSFYFAPPRVPPLFFKSHQ